MSGKHISFKRYGHERGLSCCFRQWKSDSHCALLHGYALAVEFEFHADTLNDKNWVMDFGGLGWLKEYLETLLDHTLLVAQDDPQLDELCMLSEMKLARVLVLPAVGCEALAQQIYDYVSAVLYDMQKNGHQRVTLHKVRIDEHGANGAAYVSE